MSSTKKTLLYSFVLLLTFGFSFNTTFARTLFSPPTASINIGGNKNHTATTGEGVPAVIWRSTGGSQFRTVLMVNNPNLCNGIRDGQVWGQGNTANGSFKLNDAPRILEGCVITYRFEVENKMGQKATDSATIRYVGPQLSKPVNVSNAVKEPAKPVSAIQNTNPIISNSNSITGLSSCTISTDKKEYLTGEIPKYSWTTRNVPLTSSWEISLNSEGFKAEGLGAAGDKVSTYGTTEAGRLTIPGKYDVNFKIDTPNGPVRCSDKINITQKNIQIQPLTLLTPNGGEQWMLNSDKTIITWSPEPHSKDIKAYLERKVGNEFVIVGEMIENTKGSIVWGGHVLHIGESVPRFPTPGDGYYVRIVKEGGASDRSDAPFRILNEDALRVSMSASNEKVVYSYRNGSIIQIDKNKKVEIQWSAGSGADNKISCVLQTFEHDKNSRVKTRSFKVPPVGSRVINATAVVGGANRSIAQIDCTNKLGTRYAFIEAQIDNLNWTSNQKEITPTISYGDEGEKVSLIQQALKKAGFFNEEITGYFGSLTKKAVEQFQTANALENIGAVGPKTSQLLNQILLGR